MCTGSLLCHELPKGREWLLYLWNKDLAHLRNSTCSSKMESISSVTDFPCFCLHSHYNPAKWDSLLFTTRSLCSVLYLLRHICTYADLHQSEIPAAICPEACPLLSQVWAPCLLPSVHTLLEELHPSSSLLHLGIGKIYFKNMYHWIFHIVGAQ